MDTTSIISIRKFSGGFLTNIKPQMSQVKLVILKKIITACNIVDGCDHCGGLSIVKEKHYIVDGCDYGGGLSIAKECR